MIDAQKKILSEESEDKENDMESHHGNESNIKLSNKIIDITEDDIIANAIIFFLAGYETTASMLSFLFYSLAIHPECQQKLYEEVIQFNSQADYDTIARMPYLDACISETLRLFTAVPFIERTASEDYPLGLMNILLELK
jgi:cytochrome P450